MRQVLPMSRRSLFGALTRGALLAGLALAGIFAGLVVLYAFAPPVSTLMLGRRIQGKSYERVYVRLNEISPDVVAAVIASEDARFCRNGGVDWDALHEVLNDEDGPKRGAS